MCDAEGTKWLEWLVTWLQWHQNGTIWELEFIPYREWSFLKNNDSRESSYNRRQVKIVVQQGIKYTERKDSRSTYCANKEKNLYS